MSANRSVNAAEDLTTKLPDAVLCKVVSYVPSLAQRFKLAAVNKKFRRCVAAQFTKPMPLNIDFSDERLNGDAVPACRIPQAMEALAPKTHFNEISIVSTGFVLKEAWLEPKRLNRVLSILAKSECLDQVRLFHAILPRSQRSGSLETFAALFEPDIPSCEPALLAGVLAKCPKLSTLQLDAQLCPPKVRPSFPRIVRLDLRSVVANKPLTQLKIELSDYSQKDLVNLFQSLEPNKLQTLDLTLSITRSTTPTPNLAELFNNTRAAWSALREIRLENSDFNTSVLLGGLFGTVVPQLPLVESCRFECLLPITQGMVTSLQTLFNNSKRELPIVTQVAFRFKAFNGLWGCRLVNVIGQLQQVHPGLQVHFQGGKVRFELDNVTCFLGPFLPCPCNPDCVQCGWVYSVVVYRIKEEATRKRSLHLRNCRLDRCKVDRIVTELNPSIGIPCRALFAAINETGDLVVIAFEDGDGDQFYITVDRAYCLSGGCIGCVEI